MQPGSTLANCSAGASSFVSGRRIPAVFNSVEVTPEPAAVLPTLAEKAGVIEIEFASGGRMRISGSVDASTVSALTKALTEGKRRR